jgi:hypothetical protein
VFLSLNSVGDPACCAGRESRPLKTIWSIQIRLWGANLKKLLVHRAKLVQNGRDGITTHPALVGRIADGANRRWGESSIRPYAMGMAGERLNSGADPAFLPSLQGVVLFW